jgi:predicted Ser/Thr protein kinase
MENLELRISDLEARMSAIEAIVATDIPSKTKTRKLSVREFMLEKQPANDIQKTLTIAYFIENNENISPFNANDLRRYFDYAKEQAPQNINYTVIKNIEKGYIMEYTEKKSKKKAWKITNTGERFVENNFPKNR